MKKLLFLLTIVLTLFTVVVATESDVLLISPAPDATNEVVENVEDSAEVVPEDATEESAEKVDDTTESTPTDSEVPTTGTEVDDTEETTTSGSNSTIVGAILDIVIVVAVIALVALLQKK